MAIANSIGLLKSQQVLVQKMHISAAPYDIRVRPWYNPDGVTAYYMVPALLGIIMTMLMTMLTSMAIVRERERGTLEQLIATPIKSYELMIGKVVPYILFGLYHDDHGAVLRVRFSFMCPSGAAFWSFTP
jgi:ABC-2 type transport system permease protein